MSVSSLIQRRDLYVVVKVGDIAGDILKEEEAKKNSKHVLWSLPSHRIYAYPRIGSKVLKYLELCL